MVISTLLISVLVIVIAVVIGVLVWVFKGRRKEIDVGPNENTQKDDTQKATVKQLFDVIKTQDMRIEEINNRYKEDSEKINIAFENIDIAIREITNKLGITNKLVEEKVETIAVNEIIIPNAYTGDKEIITLIKPIQVPITSIPEKTAKLMSKMKALTESEKQTPKK